MGGGVGGENKKLHLRAEGFERIESREREGSERGGGKEEEGKEQEKSRRKLRLKSGTWRRNFGQSETDEEENRTRKAKAVGG